MKAIRVKDTWARAGVYYVRTEAMVLGYDVSLQGEFDTDTPETEYVLVVDDKGKPISTCRIHVLDDDPAVEPYAKIERVATVSGARGQGAGRLAIEEAERWIQEKGVRKIIITSRDEAVGFYQRLGYTLDETEKERPETAPSEAHTDAQADHSPHFVIVRVQKIIE